MNWIEWNEQWRFIFFKWQLLLTLAVREGFLEEEGLELDHETKKNGCERATLSNIVPTCHMWQFKLKCKLIHITFQVHDSYM